MLDWKVDVSSDWAEVRAEYGQCICFQQVESYTPPEWPNQDVPQQVHLDVIVDDLDVGELPCSTSARPSPTTNLVRRSECSRDPAGHPFCLCVE